MNKKFDEYEKSISNKIEISIGCFLLILMSINIVINLFYVWSDVITQFLLLLSIAAIYFVIRLLTNKVLFSTITNNERLIIYLVAIFEMINNISSILEKNIQISFSFMLIDILVFYMEQKEKKHNKQNKKEKGDKNEK